MSGDSHPWTRGGVRIARAVLDRIDEEARGAWLRDEESCGLLIGPPNDLVIDEIVPMENRANKLHRLDPETYPRTGRMYFDIDPLKFEKAVRAGANSGRPVKVLYHSHLDVGAYFSATDASAATMGGDRPTYELAYLVTSVRGVAPTEPENGTRSARVDDHKLFVWDEPSRSFVESPFVVD